MSVIVKYIIFLTAMHVILLFSIFISILIMYLKLIRDFLGTHVSYLVCLFRTVSGLLIVREKSV